MGKLKYQSRIPVLHCSGCCYPVSTGQMARCADAKCEACVSMHLRGLSLFFYSFLFHWSSYCYNSRGIIQRYFSYIARLKTSDPAGLSLNIWLPGWSVLHLYGNVEEVRSLMGYHPCLSLLLIQGFPKSLLGPLPPPSALFDTERYKAASYLVERSGWVF